MASRRKVEELIKEGRVTLNGKTVTELATIVEMVTLLSVNGSPLIMKRRSIIFLMSTRVISSVSDEKNRKTVIDLMPHVMERIYPVGRLD